MSKYGNMTMLVAAGSVMPFSQMLSAAEKEQRLNILLVIFDDLRPELGCYGVESIVTPNIDSVAAQGCIFTRAYVQQAISAASRASLLTGCRPDVTGVDYPYSEYFVNDFLPEHPSMQRLLLENGYYTRTLGKIHHGFSEKLSAPHFSPKGHHLYALQENIAVADNDSLAPLIECPDLPDNAYKDGKTAQKAVAVIRDYKENHTDEGPLFLSVGFHKPHIPFCAPEKYFDFYDRDSLPLTANPEHTKGVSPYSESHTALTKFNAEDDGPDKVVSIGTQMDVRHGYYACISYVDALFGKIVSALKDTGLYDNTAIVLLGDHGWHIGDNGMYGKATNFEKSTNAPLIVRVPGMESSTGVSTDALVEFVDIYPTVCDLAGVPVPEYVEGTSLMSLLNDPYRKWKSAAFSQYPRGNVEGFSVRTDRYRYTEWKEKNDVPGKVVAVELYDHLNDPEESVNVAKVKSGVAVRMAKILESGWKKALPPGCTNDSENEPAPPFVPWGPEAYKVL